VIFLDAQCALGYGGFFQMSGLEPNTEYTLRYLSPSVGSFAFNTDRTGSARAGGGNDNEPFELEVRIWRDLNHDFLVNDGEVVAIEAHFIVDVPCQDVFPEPN
jgi:hypothetical protein